MNEITRRDTLKLSGIALGALALGNVVSGCGSSSGAASENNEGLETFIPGEPLDPNEMRITFLGTSCIPRINQECNGVFVELGNGDCFLFDCGSGISAKQVAMGIRYAQFDKIFLTHLHGDHTSDIITIYCFGPNQDRKTALKIWGPSANTPEEGTTAFGNTLKSLMKWHAESFSFLPTGLKNGDDGYNIVTTELPYMEVGTAYESNGVKITHFPAVHCRDGSISYKLEWNGLSMVFTGDTKPNNYVIQNARGVDVLIHEMVVPPETWAAKNSGLSPGDANWDIAVSTAQKIEDSSHTPQKALGYIFSQTNPRVGVATHFQAESDTIGPAMSDIRTWYSGPVIIATDLLVLNVSRAQIRQRMAVVSDLAWYATPYITPEDQLAAPKYPTPTAQLNQTLLDNCIPESVYNP
jgi:ribonuclease Z